MLEYEWEETSTGITFTKLHTTDRMQKSVWLWEAGKYRERGWQLGEQKGLKREVWRYFQLEDYLYGDGSIDRGFEKMLDLELWSDGTRGVQRGEASFWGTKNAD